MKRVVSLCLVAILAIMSSASSVNGAYNMSMSMDKNTGDVSAYMLKDLGLFKGVSEDNFDLERQPTRLEGLVMLIRLLGEEKDAMATTAKSPFNDVPNWGKKYVDYAYAKGYTKGVSATKFDASAPMPSIAYLTFVLRALGYSDSKGDFTYNNPYDLAKSINVLYRIAYLENFDKFDFSRADVANVSLNALNCNMKGTSTILAQQLVKKGAISPYKLYSVGNMWGKQTDLPAGMKVVKVSTVKEFFDAVDDNTVIMLQAGKYDISNYLSSFGEGTEYINNNKKCKIKGKYDGLEAVIVGAKNLHIIGVDNKKVEITTSSMYSDVLLFNKCNDCSISSVTMGHSPARGACEGAVVALEECNNFTVKDCVLYGCGIFGVFMDMCENIMVYENEIKECSQSGVGIKITSQVKILGCYFHDNDCFYKPSYSDVEKDMPIVFSKYCDYIYNAGNYGENNTFGDLMYW